MYLCHVRRWNPSLVQYFGLATSGTTSSILSVHTPLFHQSSLFIFASFLMLDCLLLHITNFMSVALLWCLENGIRKKILLLEKKGTLF